MRRIGEYFSYRVDALSADDLAGYFTDLLAANSWSGVKLDLYGWKFFTEHVLRKLDPLQEFAANRSVKYPARSSALSASIR